MWFPWFPGIHTPHVLTSFPKRFFWEQFALNAISWVGCVLGTHSSLCYSSGKTKPPHPKFEQVDSEKDPQSGRSFLLQCKGLTLQTSL